jgi:acetyltransferase-like isoleucine patch superfamily enzyme
MISGHTYIVSATHRFDSTSGEPYVKQGEVRIGVTIGDNAWVAANCVVMDGVTIGNGAVIGAGSVVTRSIPPLVLAAGCPARIIRSLSESELQPRR